MITKVQEKQGVEVYRLTGSKGAYVEILNYGARLHHLYVPSRTGELLDVIAGFNDVTEYLGDNPYFNAVIGRVSNRIKGAAFTFEGKRYSLFPNEGVNHLHGGREGFDRKFFTAKIEGEELLMTYCTVPNEEGYPGSMQVSVRYSFSQNNTLTIRLSATCDQDTPVSLTSHAYFNLSGDFNKNILDTRVRIAGSAFTEFDDDLIITGAIPKVEGTPYDFRKERSIEERMYEPVPALQKVQGYDNNYILDEKEPAAVAVCPQTGIRLTVSCNAPCLQFYTGNLLHGEEGRNKYNIHAAFCMEPQEYPDAVNKPAFPLCVLRKGERYERFITYAFDVEK